MLASDRGDACRQHEAGFSALEAMVAIAILSAAVMPIFVLQSQNTAAALRLERQGELTAVKQAVDEYATLIDFYEQPVGEMSIGGGWSLNWDASAGPSEEPALYGMGLRSRYVVRRATVILRASHLEFGSSSFEKEVVTIGEQRPYSSAGDPQ